MNPARLNLTYLLFGEAFSRDKYSDKIPDKIEDTLYCLYTEDHSKGYTTILGCKVNSLTDIPDDKVGKNITTGNHSKRTVKGNLNEGLVFIESLQIWKTDLKRSFTTDYEVYGPKAPNLENTEVEIFLAID